MFWLLPYMDIENLQASLADEARGGGLCICIGCLQENENAFWIILSCISLYRLFITSFISQRLHKSHRCVAVILFALSVCMSHATCLRS